MTPNFINDVDCPYSVSREICGAHNTNLCSHGAFSLT